MKHVGFFLYLLCMNQAFAVPTLQLDIDGGEYIGVDPSFVDALQEGTLTEQSQFTLDAIFTRNKKKPKPNFDYFLTVALLDVSGESVNNLGAGLSIDIAGDTLNASDFTFGKPAGLAPHGVYDTFFATIQFSFADADVTEINTYNVQNDIGDPLAGVGSLLKTFAVDVTDLNREFIVHFDLTSEPFGKKDKIKFAPFSHDAGYLPSVVVPEPPIALLFVSGLLLFAGARMRSSTLVK